MSRAPQLIEFQGRAMSLSAWARELGVPYHTAYDRLKRGLPLECVFARGVLIATTARLVTYGGKTQSLFAHCRELGVPYGRVLDRLRYGWPFDRAVTEPPRRPSIPPHAA